MINFTVGPVQSCKEILSIGSEQIPYFRTKEFSKIMFENEKLIKKFVNANSNSRTVFLTGSGTASMEAAIINTLTKKDKILIVNGGSFGKRFVEICETYSLNYTEILLEFGEQITEEKLSLYDNKGYTVFLINIHETSTGLLYDLDVVSKFCKKNNLFFIVDAISSFLADKIDVKKNSIDILITGSQKALACPPGISIIVLSQESIDRVNKCENPCYYLNLKNALSNAERGQTPFTPAVSILLQINKRLNIIENNGGVQTEINKVNVLAEDFRKKIKDLPFKIATKDLSNALTSLIPLSASAYDIFNILKDEYGIWICPNGGELKDKIFRVGHIGELTSKDNDKLIDALKDLRKRGLI